MPAKILAGGPMMGLTVYDLDTPVTKGTSGILALTAQEVQASSGRHASSAAAASRPVPWGSVRRAFKWLDHVEYDEALAEGLMDCRECGCCSYICPAHIPLVQGFRVGEEDFAEEEGNGMSAQQEAPTRNDVASDSRQHFHDEDHVDGSLCLVPAGLWGVWVFGLQALWVTLASIAAATATEYVIARLLGRSTLFDGSAFLTGLLVSYNMPPSIPFYMPVVASVFAIAVVKWSFGGLGGNWMNPALAGRVFVFFSWTGAHDDLDGSPDEPGTRCPERGDAAEFHQGGTLDFEGGASGPMAFLNAQGYAWSGFDRGITNWLNAVVLDPLGIRMPGGYVDVFVGNIPGSLGEVSALLLLPGAIYLFGRRIITWHVPVSYLGTFALLVWLFGGLRYGGGLFTGDILFNLFTGGLMLGVFYMATDMVTSPFTPRGMLIFGAGAGFLTFMIRVYGSFPEGVSLAIILMNIFVPVINRYTGPRRFGQPAKAKGAAA